MVTDVNQYLGNPNLKKANVPVEFTKEQIQEYQKCMDDPIYFIQAVSYTHLTLPTTLVV